MKLGNRHWHGANSCRTLVLRDEYHEKGKYLLLAGGISFYPGLAAFPEIAIFQGCPGLFWPGKEAGQKDSVKGVKGW